MPTNQNNGYSRVWGIIVIIAVCGIAVWNMPVAMAFNTNLLENIPQMLGYIFLIALFVERTIEVFLSAWRSQGADELDLDIQQTESDIKDLTDGQDTDPEKQKNLAQLKSTLKDMKKNRAIYSAKSRFIAHWLGLAIGVLVSLVGVRILANLLILKSPTTVQQNMFIVVDILLTGSTLAGGSEAINKIMKLYTSFMASTSKKAAG